MHRKYFWVSNFLQLLYYKYVHSDKCKGNIALNTDEFSEAHWYEKSFIGPDIISLFSYMRREIKYRFKRHTYLEKAIIMSDFIRKYFYKSCISYFLFMLISSVEKY